MSKVNARLQQSVERAFDEYVSDLESSSLSRSSKDSYAFHGRAFVRWLRGDYEPGTAGLKGYWPDTIANALRHLGGEAYLRDIEQWVEGNVSLTAHELGAGRDGGRPRYVHTVRSTANRMARAGDLENVGSPGRPKYRLRPRSTNLLERLKQLRPGAAG